MCLNHVGGWFSKTQRDKKFDPGYWIKFLEPPCTLRVLQAHGILQCSIEPMLISAGLDKLGWAVLELEEINLIVSEKAAET